MGFGTNGIIPLAQVSSGTGLNNGRDDQVTSSMSWTQIFFASSGQD